MEGVKIFEPLIENFLNEIDLAQTNRMLCELTDMKNSSTKFIKRSLSYRLQKSQLSNN